MYCVLIIASPGSDDFDLEIQINQSDSIKIGPDDFDHMISESQRLLKPTMLFQATNLIAGKSVIEELRGKVVEPSTN